MGMQHKKNCFISSKIHTNQVATDAAWTNLYCDSRTAAFTNAGSLKYISLGFKNMHLHNSFV